VHKVEHGRSYTPVPSPVTPLTFRTLLVRGYVRRCPATPCTTMCAETGKKAHAIPPGNKHCIDQSLLRRPQSLLSLCFSRFVLLLVKILEPLQYTAPQPASEPRPTSPAPCGLVCPSSLALYVLTSESMSILMARTTSSSRCRHRTAQLSRT
jgi:hypothetical protein